MPRSLGMTGHSRPLPSASFPVIPVPVPDLLQLFPGGSRYSHAAVARSAIRQLVLPPLRLRRHDVPHRPASDRDPARDPPRDAPRSAPCRCRTTSTARTCANAIQPAPPVIRNVVPSCRAFGMRALHVTCTSACVESSTISNATPSPSSFHAVNARRVGDTAPARTPPPTIAAAPTRESVRRRSRHRVTTSSSSASIARRYVPVSTRRDERAHRIRRQSRHRIATRDVALCGRLESRDLDLRRATPARRTSRRARRADFVYCVDDRRAVSRGERARRLRAGSARRRQHLRRHEPDERDDHAAE